MLGESQDKAIPPQHDAMLLDAVQVGQVLSVSEKMVRKLDATGRLPVPVNLGRCVRWRRQELAAWVQAGCPPRDQWEQMRD